MTNFKSVVATFCKIHVKKSTLLKIVYRGHHQIPKGDQCQSSVARLSGQPNLWFNIKTKHLLKYIVTDQILQFKLVHRTFRQKMF